MPVSTLDFWAPTSSLPKALTDGMVRDVQERLGVEIPGELIKLLSIQNGGYTKGFVFPTNQKTSWSHNHVPLDELFGIVSNYFADTVPSISTLSKVSQEWGLPANQVLLCGDGHWFITLDYREKSIPSIAWIDTEMEEDVQIASDFATFFNGLVDSDSFDYEEED
jgi:hypothetical protein